MSVRTPVPSDAEAAGGAAAPSPTLLGQLLLAENIITFEELREALCRQQECRHPLGQILLAMGALTAPQLERALQAQARLRRAP